MLKTTALEDFEVKYFNIQLPDTESYKALNTNESKEKKDKKAILNEWIQTESLRRHYVLNE